MRSVVEQLSLEWFNFSYRFESVFTTSIYFKEHKIQMFGNKRKSSEYQTNVHIPSL
jgi:hypothetical protein